MKKYNASPILMQEQLIDEIADNLARAINNQIYVKLSKKYFREIK